MGYLSTLYTSIAHGESYYIIIKPVDGGAWGDINLNLTEPSNISITGVSTDSKYCIERVFGINGTAESRTGEYKSASYSGNCPPEVLDKLILTTQTFNFNFSGHIISPNINCSPVISKEILSDANSFDVPLPKNLSQNLTFYIYKNKTLIKTFLAGSYNSISVNLSQFTRPYFIEVYSPDYKTYSCEEIVAYFPVQNRTT